MKLSPHGPFERRRPASALIPKFTWPPARIAGHALLASIAAFSLAGSLPAQQVSEIDGHFLVFPDGSRYAPACVRFMTEEFSFQGYEDQWEDTAVAQLMATTNGLLESLIGQEVQLSSRQSDEYYPEALIKLEDGSDVSQTLIAKGVAVLDEEGATASHCHFLLETEADALQTSDFVNDAWHALLLHRAGRYEQADAFLGRLRYGVDDATRALLAGVFAEHRATGGAPHEYLTAAEHLKLALGERPQNAGVRQHLHSVLATGLRSAVDDELPSGREIAAIYFETFPISPLAELGGFSFASDPEQEKVNREAHGWRTRSYALYVRGDYAGAARMALKSLERVNPLMLHDLKRVRKLADGAPPHLRQRTYERLVELVRSGAVKEFYSEFFGDKSKSEAAIEKAMEEDDVELVYLRLASESARASRVALLWAAFPVILVGLAFFALLAFPGIRRRMGKMVGGVALVLLVTGFILFLLSARRGAAAEEFGRSREQIEERLKGLRANLAKARQATERAIELARAFAPEVEGYVSDLKGEIQVVGWEADRRGEGIYLASYTYTPPDETSNRGWWFEVDVEHELVRRVIGDTALEEKYGLVATDDP